MKPQFIGIDVGAETVRVVGLDKRGNRLVVTDRLHAEHNKDPGGTVLALLSRLDLSDVEGMAATGRLGRLLRTELVPSSLQGSATPSSRRRRFVTLSRQQLRCRVGAPSS